MSTQEKNTTTIQIDTTQGDWNDAQFEKTAKVDFVIQAVVNHFSFAKNGKYQLALESDPSKPLDQQRTLVSYGIVNGTVLIFTEIGGGV